MCMFILIMVLMIVFIMFFMIVFIMLFMIVFFVISMLIMMALIIFMVMAMFMVLIKILFSMLIMGVFFTNMFLMFMLSMFMLIVIVFIDIFLIMAIFMIIRILVLILMTIVFFMLMFLILVLTMMVMLVMIVFWLWFWYTMVFIVIMLTVMIVISMLRIPVLDTAFNAVKVLAVFDVTAVPGVVAMGMAFVSAVPAMAVAAECFECGHESESDADRQRALQARHPQLGKPLPLQHFVEGDVEQGAGGETLQKPHHKQVRAASLLHVPGDQQPHQHSHRAHQAQHGDVEQHPQLGRTARQQVGAHAEHDGGGVQRHSDEQFPHPVCSLLQTYGHPLEQGVDGEGEQEEDPTAGRGGTAAQRARLALNRETLVGRGGQPVLLWGACYCSWKIPNTLL